jgi:DNA polymerase-4
MAILAEYTDLIEQVSIDEAFLDVTQSFRLHGSGEQIAKAIKANIMRREELTASVGVASNKFLAKIASDLEKPDGLVIVPPGRERDFLAPLPLSRIWGVGDKTSTILKSMGWETIGQLAALPREVLESRLGENGGHLWELANGLDSRAVMPDENFKSIGHEITYDRDTDNPRVWHATLLALIDRVAHRLRKHEIAGRTITLKVRFEDFSTFTRRKTVRELLSTTEEIYPIVEGLFAEFAGQRRKLRLLGVYVSNLSTGKIEQKSLFNSQHRKLESLSHAVDSIEQRFGEGIICRAVLVKKNCH